LGVSGPLDFWLERCLSLPEYCHPRGGGGGGGLDGGGYVDGFVTSLIWSTVSHTSASGSDFLRPLRDPPDAPPADKFTSNFVNGSSMFDEGPFERLASPRVDLRGLCANDGDAVGLSIEFKSNALRIGGIGIVPSSPLTPWDDVQP
jgi:hypothetical protein